MAKKKGQNVSSRRDYFHNPIEGLVLVKPAPPQPPPTPAEAAKDKAAKIEEEGL